ncbi:MAG: NAD(P)-binding protein, partial [Alphaproteobacteria bacterium]|nr:NAD(P)-binding protein [Alphaproteobacteria bacterium]
MASKRDKELGMDRPIARRDFLQGAAITLAAAGTLSPELVAAAQAEQLAQNGAGYYPPTRLGMRGSHPGSYEAAHEVRDGDFWQNAAGLVDTGETFDLVVVGGGISGLSAAHFYREAHPKARILIIENHDDFGGHAKRNEFHVDHRMLLLNGGTMDIDSPYPYSQVANGLLNKLGVYPVELAKTCDDPEIYKSRQLKPGVYFDKETFGTDRLVLGMAEYGRGPKSPEAVKAFLAKTPLAPKVQRDVLRIETGDEDYLPGLSSDQKK